MKAIAPVELIEKKILLSRYLRWFPLDIIIPLCYVKKSV
jgi:hypothetical protein